jgi:hypothetical protein
MGALLARGKERAGKIPKGKLVNFEAMTAPGCETFSKIAKSWMKLEKTSQLFRRFSHPYQKHSQGEGR